MSDRILRLKEVESVTGLKRSSIYEKIKAGEFPKQVSLSERTVGWYESEIQNWINSRGRVNEASQKSA
jgi:prophage regulatory protein